VPRLLEHPAVVRLLWLLEWVADGSPQDDGSLTANLAPTLLTRQSIDEWVHRMRALAVRLARAEIRGIEVGEHSARAWVTTADGEVFLISCVVEATRPHRLESADIAPRTPPGLTPRLPLEFPTCEQAGGAVRGAQLFAVISGVPGSGKSTLADAVGTVLGVPVFSSDWLLGALTPFGGRAFDGLGDMGIEVLTTLAFRQLSLGQSVIFDTTARDLVNRTRWRTLADHFGARFKPVLCTCPDPAIHKKRALDRRRGIPGWHDAGNWPTIQAERKTFPPWTSEVLAVDTTRSLAECVADTVAYLRA
jgi:predicted kinase